MQASAGSTLMASQAKRPPLAILIGVTVAAVVLVAVCAVAMRGTSGISFPALSNPPKGMAPAPLLPGPARQPRP
jgi:hypothetical protein